MSNHDFTLKSGAKLHISTAPMALAWALTVAVKKIAREGNPQSDILDVVLFDKEVTEALWPVFDLATWNTWKVTRDLFDDQKMGEKARADYFEICSRVIEVNTRPFFLMTSSGSSEQKSLPTGSPKP